MLWFSYFFIHISFLIINLCVISYLISKVTCFESMIEWSRDFSIVRKRSFELQVYYTFIKFTQILPHFLIYNYLMNNNIMKSIQKLRNWQIIAFDWNYLNYLPFNLFIENRKEISLNLDYFSIISSYYIFIAWFQLAQLF